MIKLQLNLYFCIITTLLSSVAMSQQSTWITLGYDGFLPKVIEVENNTTSDLYKKSLEWAKNYYPNYEKELVLDSTDYKLKIRSTKSEAFYIGLKRNLYDLDYSVTISFKDNKYRVEFEINDFFYNPRNTKYRAEGESQKTGWDQKEFYEIIDGDRFLDPGKRDGYAELTQTINSIASSLLEEMRQKKELLEQNSSDNW